MNEIKALKFIPIIKRAVSALPKATTLSPEDDRYTFTTFRFYLRDVLKWLSYQSKEKLLAFGFAEEDIEKLLGYKKLFIITVDDQERTVTIRPRAYNTEMIVEPLKVKIETLPEGKETLILQSLIVLRSYQYAEEFIVKASTSTQALQFQTLAESIIKDLKLDEFVALGLKDNELIIY